MPRVEAFARDALRPAATRQARAPYSVLASDLLCACTCLPPERSPSCRPGLPTTAQFAIARPTFAAYCGPPPNPPVSPDPQETARCMPASSCPQTRTLSVIWESSVSARTLASLSLNNVPRDSHVIEGIGCNKSRLSLPE